MSRRRAMLAAAAFAALLVVPLDAAKDPLTGFDAFVAGQLEVWKVPGASGAIVQAALYTPFGNFAAQKR